MRLLHLYYDLMNLYGEYGNIVVLKKHLEDQDIEVSVDKKTLGDEINFEEYDFIYCGSGTEKNQLVALDDLLKRKDSLDKAIKENSMLFFTGNSMELLGKSIDDKKALNIVPISTKTTNNRYTGDVIVSNKEIGEVVGFINKCSIISENDDIKLFDYIFKDSNLPNDGYEGYKVNNIYGTHIIGPILVKNPNLMKDIVTKLIKKDNPNFKYKQIDYPYESDSYNVTLNALKERIK